MLEWYHDDDPTLIAYNNFRDTFGQDDMFIIAMKPQGGLTKKFFATLFQIHNELEDSVPYLDDITSLVLCGGFFIYTTSYLLINIRFGLLTGCAVLFALAADFFLVPALLSLAYGKR